MSHLVQQTATEASDVSIVWRLRKLRYRFLSLAELHGCGKTVNNVASLMLVLSTEEEMFVGDNYEDPWGMPHWWGS